MSETHEVSVTLHVPVTHYVPVTLNVLLAPVVPVTSDMPITLLVSGTQGGSITSVTICGSVFHDVSLPVICQ